MSCRHAFKNHYVKWGQWTDHHPYGEDTYDEYHLACKKCKHEKHITDSGRILVREYEEFCGRSMSFENLQKLFRENNEIFHCLCDMDSELRRAIMSNPPLERKIQRKRTLIQKHQKELEQLVTEYETGGAIENATTKCFFIG